MGMANLIDRDSLMAQLEDRQAFLVKEWGYRDHYTRGFEEAVDKVEDQPTVDAVEVVRCRDCKHREESPWFDGYRCGNPDEGMASGVVLRDNDFCSYGERKDNGK